MKPPIVWGQAVRVTLKIHHGTYGTSALCGTDLYGPRKAHRADKSFREIMAIPSLRGVLCSECVAVLQAVERDK